MEKNSSILDEMRELIYQQSQIQFKLLKLIEEKKKPDFWEELDKEIDRCKAEVNHHICQECDKLSYAFDRNMLKDCGLVYKLERAMLYEEWIRMPYKGSFFISVIDQLEYIMEAHRICNRNNK